MVEIHYASGAPRHGAKALLAQLFHRLSVAPLGRRVLRGRELLYEIKLRGLYRQLLPSGAAPGEVATRKRLQSRNIAPGSRANDNAATDDRDRPLRGRSHDRVVHSRQSSRLRYASSRVDC